MLVERPGVGDGPLFFHGQERGMRTILGMGLIICAAVVGSFLLCFGLGALEPLAKTEGGVDGGFIALLLGLVVRGRVVIAAVLGGSVIAATLIMREHAVNDALELFRGRRD